MPVASPPVAVAGRPSRLSRLNEPNHLNSLPAPPGLAWTGPHPTPSPLAFALQSTGAYFSDPGTTTIYGGDQTCGCREMRRKRL
jgi:hypothetical protein